MSALGKILGGTIGFAFGGPIGALFGVVAGHFVEKSMLGGEGTVRKRDLRDTPGQKGSPEELQWAFIFSLITLAAKLSKVDGKVTRDEVETLKAVFPIPEDAYSNVHLIFNAAKSDSLGFEPYARQIRVIFSDDRNVLESFLAGLLQIAVADGVYHPSERRFLASVARIFGFSDGEWSRIEGTYISSARDDTVDPYEVLGLSPDASDSEIRAAYLKIIRNYHPDRLEAQGIPVEFRKLGETKTAEANDAYDRIKKMRELTN